jgi:hypothetical protein
LILLLLRNALSLAGRGVQGAYLVALSVSPVPVTSIRKDSHGESIWLVFLVVMPGILNLEIAVLAGEEYEALICNSIMPG